MGPLRLQAALLAVLLGASLIGCSSDSSSPTEPSPLDISTTTGSSTLSATAASALDTAIDDEYKARAFYDAVIERFGPVRPFVPIRDAETRHIEALVGLYNTYSLAAPSDPHAGDLDPPDSYKRPVKWQSTPRIANAALYDEIMRGRDRAGRDHGLRATPRRVSLQPSARFPEMLLTLGTSNHACFRVLLLTQTCAR